MKLKQQPPRPPSASSWDSWDVYAPPGRLVSPCQHCGRPTLLKACTDCHRTLRPNSRRPGAEARGRSQLPAETQYALAEMGDYYMLHQA